MAKVLSVRQPWAWAIIYGGKDIENRKWKTGFRGRVFIHASKQYDPRGFRVLGTDQTWTLQTGGIIGCVTIVDCVTKSDSKWFEGPYGFVLRDPTPIEFMPAKGQLGFFELKNAVYREGTQRD